MYEMLEAKARRAMFVRDEQDRLVFFPRAVWFGLARRGYRVPEGERAAAITRTATRHYVRQSRYATYAGLVAGILAFDWAWQWGAVAWFVLGIAANEAWYVTRIRRLVSGLAVAEGVRMPSWQVYADPDGMDADTHRRHAILWGVLLAVLLAIVAWQISGPPGRRGDPWITSIAALLLGIHFGSRIVAMRTVQLREEKAELERRIAERTRELAEANRHKSEFLANMSHELRTPLNAIIGFSEALDARMFGELNEKQAEYIRDIHSSGRHLLALINDILDLSKVEAGRMELEPAEVDLAALLEGALALVRERATRHGIRLELEAAPDVGTFHGDERRLRQAVLNLLSNAVKFTPEDGRVTVRARRLGDSVEVAVVDTGVGIAPEHQEAIFEEFRQVGSDYTRKAEGTGLGLALARRFVQMHGGSIRVESAPGKGSTFTICLPLRHG